MQPSLRRRTSGFTLVEILVVIVIISILAALATPAVLRAMHRVEEAAIQLEVNNLAQAVEAYRTEYGEYPPDFTDPQAVVNHLNRIHPRRRNVPREMPTANDVQDYMDQYNLNPSRALAFWLRGFHPNPEFPISGDVHGDGSPDSDRKPFMEFEVRTISGGDGDLETLEPNEYIIPTRGQPAPMVYFTSATCPSCTNPYEVNERGEAIPKFVGTPNGQVRPYVRPRRNEPQVFELVNPKTFQIISAGRDGQFGEYGTDPQDRKWHTLGLNFTDADNDNVANFSETNLQNAIE